MTHPERLAALAKEIQMTRERYIEEFELPLASVAGALSMVQQVITDTAIRDFEVSQAAQEENDDDEGEEWKE